MESAEDPMKHVVKYTYERGNLASVTLAWAKKKPRWQFKYNTEHELTSVTDGREHTITWNTTKPTRSARRRIRCRANVRGNTLRGKRAPKRDHRTQQREHDRAVQRIRVADERHARRGNVEAATGTYEYNVADELTRHRPQQTRHRIRLRLEWQRDIENDANGRRNANGNTTRTHDIETETTPEGETTTIKRNSKRRPGSDRTTGAGQHHQKTTYKSASNGDVESMTDPLGTRMEI